MRQALRTALIASLTMLIASCGSGEPIAPLSDWGFETKTDPLTDATVFAASTAVFDENRTFRLEVVMNCSVLNGNATFETTLTTFNTEDEPAPLRLSGFGAATAQLRIGDEPARQLMATGLEYNNQMRLLTETSNIGELPLAQRIVFNPALQNGDPVFVIDLSDANARRVLQECASAFPDALPPVAQAAGEPGTGQPIEANSVSGWVSAFRANGDETRALSDLAGAIGEPQQADYTHTYVLQQKRVFLGHQVLALEVESDGVNDIGCCRRPRIALQLRRGGDAAALTAYATQNACEIVEDEQALRLDCERRPDDYR